MTKAEFVGSVFMLGKSGRGKTKLMNIIGGSDSFDGGRARRTYALQ